MRKLQPSNDGNYPFLSLQRVEGEDLKTELRMNEAEISSQEEVMIQCGIMIELLLYSL